MIYKLLRNAFSIAMMATFAASSITPLPASAAVSDWQQGASIYPRTTSDIATPAGLASLDQLAASGANYATIIIPYYQSNLASSDLHPGYDTPSDEALLTAIAHARAKGMNVMLKPHLEPLTGEWRAHINPADRAAWYQAYGDMLVHYARLAEASGVAQLCIGSELVNVSSSRVNPDNTGRWQAIIATVRSVFSGSLTYSAQRPGPMGELETIQFWSQLDYIGSSGYFPLEIAGEPTVEKIQAAWASWELHQIRPIHERYNKPVLFTEVGYRSLSGSHNDPWSYLRQGAVSEHDQAVAYDAFFGFWNGANYMHGVHLWDWEPNPEAGGPASTSYTPQNKAAYGVLGRWWDGGSATAPLPGPAPATEAGPATAPAAAVIPVATAETATPTPSTSPATNQTITVSGFSLDGTLSGLQSFQASLPGHAADQYDLYWRVDNGQLNPMANHQEGSDLKEAPVDVSLWNWNAQGVYTVDFVAHDKTGRQIAAVSIPVTVRR